MDFKRCSKNQSDPLIVVEENKRKFIISNASKERVTKVRVDGCLIKDDRQRCDYVFELGVSKHCVIYLELKGCDVGKAFNQLVATMAYLADRHKDCEKICHIVASRVPRAGPSVQALKLQMVRKLKAQLIIDTNQATIHINSMPYCVPTTKSTKR